MSRKGESIYKRKDGRWEARYIKEYRNNKAVYGYVYAKSYAEVKKKRNTIMQNLESLLKTQKYSKKHIFHDVCFLWLESIQNNIKLSTYARYYQIVHTHLIPKLGEHMIEDIDNILIDKYLHYLFSNGRLDQKGGLSSKTISDILIVIKGIFRYANSRNIPTIVQLEYIKVRKPKTEVRVLTKHEQKILHDYLMNHKNCINIGILLSLYTGIRIGELCALRWDQIDLERRIIHITSTMQRISNCNKGETKTSLVITTPKSASSTRIIPLPYHIVMVLKMIQQTDNSFLLSGSNHQVEPRIIQNKFKSIIHELEIEDINFHCLRHTFATRCVEMNFEVKSLSEILGHSNVNITLDRYVHSSLQLKQENMNKIDSLILDYS